jgi:hypothetical protein
MRMRTTALTRPLIGSALALLLAAGSAGPADAAQSARTAEVSRAPAARSVVGDTFSTEPIAALLGRVLPVGAAGGFDLVAVAAGTPRPDGGDEAEWFRVSGAGDSVRVEATTASAMLRGIKEYLNDVAGVDLSWNGDSIDHLTLPLARPAEAIVGAADVSHRFSGNDTEDGYTGAFRTWKDWEHEIDVLALQGINEVFIPVGSEAVYLDTFRQFGYSEAELLQWIPQPTHQPWWLLQNMCCFPSAMSAEEIEIRARLGRRIADHARDLGMTPVLPGYFGTVPDGFAERNPGARVIPQGGWVGFQRPGWLDPTGPAFAEVAAAFYASLEERLGDSTMYKLDLLHAGGRSGDVDVAAASKAVETALQDAHPGAIWAILGWQDNPKSQTLAGIDTSRMLIVDGLADRYNGLNREQAWRGTPYAFGSIWNFGGHTTMGANMTVWNERYWAWRAKPDSALDGIAVLPEAGDNNPVALEFLASLAWADGPSDMQAWYAEWASRRYGADDPAAIRAWQTLGATAYAMPAGTWSEAQDGLFGAQPGLTVRTAATWSPTAMRYDATQFAQALPALLEVDPALRASSAYRYDLADVARQVLSNRSRDLLPRIKAAYDARDGEQFAALTREWMEAMDLVDRLGRTNAQTMLGTWLADASVGAPDDLAGQRRREAARTILTVWGNRAGNDAGLHDYANREWSGLVGGFYRERWQRYFDELAGALAEGRAPRSIDWFAMGEQWARTDVDLPRRPRGDVHEVASEVINHLRRYPAPLTVVARAVPEAVDAQTAATIEVTTTNPDALVPADDVTVTLEAPDGLGVEPLGETGAATLAPGAVHTARFRVGVTDAAEVTDLVARLTATVVAGGRPPLTAAVRVLTATGVQAPALTRSFNDARFAQRGEAWAIAGGGADLWGGTNAFGTIYRDDAMVDKTVVSTTVTSQDRTGPWARAGLIVRDDLTRQGAAGYLNLALTPDHGCVLSWDANADGRFESFREIGGFGPGTRLRLTRTGDRFTGECSRDGQSWTPVHSVEVPTADRADVGLFMTAASSTRGIATFDGFAVSSGPAPQAPVAGTHQVSDLPFLQATGGHGPWERDRHNGEAAAGDGGPIVLAGTTYAKGLGTNADAELAIHLGKACTRFTAIVGIDDTMARPDAYGDVVVEVWADTQRVFVSDVLRGGAAPATIDADVTGAETLRLVVRKYDADNWWDRTDWANAAVTCG